MKYISIILLTVLLTSCGTWNNNISNTTTLTNSENSNISTNSENENSTAEIEEEEYEEKEIKLDLKNSDTIKIELDSDNTSIESESIQISWQTITIKKSWNYEFSGELDNWQIVIETDDEKDVQIILNNVTINNNSGSAILVENANQTVINLANNSTNVISDASEYSDTSDDAPNAAIFSRDDLVINWSWTLKVTWNNADAIASKDDLFIDWATLITISKDDGIRWKDSILINSWNIDIISESDWLKSTNEEKATITINSWNINISAWDDGIHSELYITINWGTINIDKSYEWIEAKYITFNDGDINVVSSDDWINGTAWSNSSDWMEDRTEKMEDFMNWDDQTDREQMREIMEKSKNWEDLTEEEQAIVDEMEASRPQRPDWDNFSETWWIQVPSWDDFTWTWWKQINMGWGMWWDQNDGSIVYLNWWNITLNSNWDWFDSNGKIIMTWWKITIFGPEWNGNGSIDYNWSFEITWWEVIAIWSSWMVQTPWESDTVYSINIWLSTTYWEWDTILLKNSSREIFINEIWIKNFQNIVYSSSKLNTNDTYILEINSEEIESFTLTDSITTVWSSSNRMWWWRGFN